MGDSRQVITAFAYVYVVYYYDLHEESLLAKMQQVHPVVFTSMRRVQDLIAQKTGSRDLEEINSGNLWKSGNYWVHREPVIDSYDEGLEYEIRENARTVTGQMPLVFDR